MVDCAHCVIFLEVVLYTSSLSRHAIRREQRANLKFITKLGKTPSESFAMLQQVYGEETMSRTCAFQWHKRFKEGREEVEDYQVRSGMGACARAVRRCVHFPPVIQGPVLWPSPRQMPGPSPSP